MTVQVEKIKETEVLVADFGAVKLYRIIESNDENALESISEQEG